MRFKFLQSPWKNKFIQIISQAKEELFISSPFINFDATKILLDSLIKKGPIDIYLLTCLTVKNIINQSIDINSLLEFYKQPSKIKISSLVNLHAKVYLVDNKIGIITSANLTTGGLINNFEYGILIEDKKIISEIKEDMRKYFFLGNIIEKNLLLKIRKEVDKIETIKKNTNDIIKKTKLSQLLKERTKVLELELLRNRVKRGKTINAIFSDTILYLLKKKGPLRTEEIHLFIKDIHPDICDDSIDRVINGQRFGKKWKHLVRNAEQYLKRNQLIKLKDGKWQLVS